MVRSSSRSSSITKLQLGQKYAVPSPLPVLSDDLAALEVREKGRGEARVYLFWRGSLVRKASLYKTKTHWFALNYFDKPDGDVSGEPEMMQALSTATGLHFRTHKTGIVAVAFDYKLPEIDVVLKIPVNCHFFMAKSGKGCKQVACVIAFKHEPKQTFILTGIYFEHESHKSTFRVYMVDKSPEDVLKSQPETWFSEMSSPRVKVEQIFVDDIASSAKIALNAGGWVKRVQGGM